MSRYIDADALIRWCHETYQTQSTSTGKAYVSALLDGVLATPTADVVEVRHGEWIPQFEGSRLLKCSVCGYEYCDLIECGNYCGNCGAKMKGGE